MEDTTVFHNFFIGNGDTLYSLSSQEDTGDHNPMTMSISPDLGAHWSSVSLPDNAPFLGPKITEPNRDTIVVWGEKAFSGQLFISTDHGRTWTLDTVPIPEVLPNSFYSIQSISIGSGGRIVASIIVTGDTAIEGGGGSSVLAYLEPTPASVAPMVSSLKNFALYPNPATNILNIEYSSGNISIFDPLGRNYVVPRNGEALDVSSLPSGVYFVSDGVSRAKFVKE